MECQSVAGHHSVSVGHHRASAGHCGALQGIVGHCRALMTGKFGSSCPETVHTLPWMVVEQRSHFLMINIYNIQNKFLKYEGTSRQWIWQSSFSVLKIPTFLRVL